MSRNLDKFMETHAQHGSPYSYKEYESLRPPTRHMIIEYLSDSTEPDCIYCPCGESYISTKYAETIKEPLNNLVIAVNKILTIKGSFIEYNELYEALYKRVLSISTYNGDFSMIGIKRLISDAINTDGTEIAKKLNDDINRAYEAINNLLTYKKERIQALAQEKKKLFLELREIFTPLNKKVCINCTRCCCGTGDGYYNITDAIYIASLGETIKFSFKNSKERVLEILLKGNRQCSFNSKGCTIPPHLRSTICVSYKCYKLEEPIPKEVQVKMDVMRRRIAEIDTELKEIVSLKW